MRVFYPKLETYLASASEDFGRIEDGRKENLAALARYVRRLLRQGLPPKLTFICTHNSRRSHLAQVWALAAAARHGMTTVESYSGGTQATAFNPRAAAALSRAGVRVEDGDGADNPTRRVWLGDGWPALAAFSKKYDAPPNPREGFCAVMTCSEADQACPIVAGAAARIALPYDDPKAADGAANEPQVYDDRCRQICRDMLYAFSLAVRDA